MNFNHIISFCCFSEREKYIDSLSSMSCTKGQVLFTGSQILPCFILYFNLLYDSYLNIQFKQSSSIKQYVPSASCKPLTRILKYCVFARETQVQSDTGTGRLTKILIQVALTSREPVMSIIIQTHKGRGESSVARQQRQSDSNTDKKDHVEGHSLLGMGDMCTDSRMLVKLLVLALVINIKK